MVTAAEEHSQNDVPEVEAEGRKVYLPPSEILSCAACHKLAKDVKLRLCTACGEVLYCSTECQQKDWVTHKVQCGKTDRIDMESYYPFLASLSQVAHMNPDLPRHPALERKIMNSWPSRPVDLPNGTSARVLLLGDKMSLMSIGSNEWCPDAPSAHSRSKLYRRIVNEGYLLPNLLAICIAMVSEIYTTTFCNPMRQRIQSGSLRGSVRVTNGDRLAYLTLGSDEEDLFKLGQSPEKHYRIYIKTLKGDEYYLDFGMYTFNFCIMVQASPYCINGLPDLGLIPAYFMGKDYDKVKVDMFMFTPRKRFSVLRDKRVHEIVRSWERDYCDCHDEPKIFAMMDEIAGKKNGEEERKAMMLILPNAVELVRKNMEKREYRKFPKEPMIGIDGDPEERGFLDEDDDGRQEETYKYLAKQARKMKKGIISKDRWEKAFHAWAKKH